MTEQEFWEEDLDILQMKMDAYIRRIDTEAYMNGRYVYEAVLAAISPIFTKKKSEIYQYPEQPHSSNVNEEKKKKYTADEREHIGRQAILNCY